tara:strand:- start:28 stop:336 length:309 start_codon:yes stop_codon:yes gene_type:complete
MIIRVDIDETICEYGDVREYPLAEPIQSRIQKINELYDEGHTIVYWTARGSVTKKDWTELTVLQLNEWGAKYHKVELGKPHYDLYIDDKSINSDTFFKDLET